MVDFSSSYKNTDDELGKTKKNKKRKFRNIEEDGKVLESQSTLVACSISHTIQSDEEVEEQETLTKKIKIDGQWRNLDLMLSIQNESLDLQRKLELAFNFVNSMQRKEDDFDEVSQTVSNSRVISLVNEWVQSRLVFGKESIEGNKPQLDFRFWKILKFCLEESLCLQVSLSFKSELLSAFSEVGKDALSMLDKKNLFLFNERFELYSVLLDCVSLLFSSYDRVFKPSFETSMVKMVVNLVQKIYLEEFSNEKSGLLLLSLSSLILERYANFLRVHPTPKKIVKEFVDKDKLLEPLLSLLDVLHGQIDGGSSPGTVNLLKIVEEVLSNGLFHPVHLEGNDGFLTILSAQKNVELGAEVSNKSYQKKFLQDLRGILSKKMCTLGSVGELYRLFVVKVKKLKGLPVLSQDILMTGETGVSGCLTKSNTNCMSKMFGGNDSSATESSNSSSRPDIKTIYSFFNLFVIFIEPLMLKVNANSDANFEVGSMLNDAYCTLKATNRILSSFRHEKVYIRTEDTSEGEHLNFLKESYQKLVSFSSRICVLLFSRLKVDDGKPKEFVPLLKEIIIAYGYFLELEYEVVGDDNDLVSLWSMMLSYIAIDLPMIGAPARFSLASHVLHLGCQLINVYSELRQVNSPIFALCKAVRLFGIPDNNENEYSRFASPEARVQSVTILLCCQDFRVVIRNAIKSMAEGQASGCIKMLKSDMSDSFEWLKDSSLMDEGETEGPSHSSSMSNLDLRAELLGRALSEIYSVLLDFLVVTPGNSIIVGSAVKGVIKGVSPTFSILVGKQTDRVNDFLHSVIGDKNSDQEMSSSSSWVFLFFSRMYVSCRSLYRQLVSLMPPDSSTKAAQAMGDHFATYSGEDYMENPVESYFYWITSPAESLHIVRKDICVQDTLEVCPPLVYVMCTMACQRLVDLTRQIKGFEFIKEGGKILSILRQEAADVTTILTRYLPLVEKMVVLLAADACATSKAKEKEAVGGDDAWDLSIPSLTKKSLPTAVWSLLCQTTDSWCPYAKKKELRKFLSILFSIILYGARHSCRDNLEHKMGESHNLEVTLHGISLELLRDTMFYEQTFICRNLESAFCRVLEESVLPLFGDSLSRNVDYNVWLDVLSKNKKNYLKKKSKNKKTSMVLNRRQVADEDFSELKPRSRPYQSLAECSKELMACQTLLNLLCWMPQGHQNLKSFSGYANYILNLERLVILRLLDRDGESEVDIHYELFRLFLCCRKALKCLLVAVPEKDGVKTSSIVSTISDNSKSIMWLLKSVDVLLEFLPVLSKESVSQVKDLGFSLMDHTSHVILALSREQFSLAIPSLIYDKKSTAGSPTSNDLNNKDKWSLFYSNLGAWMEHITENLKESSQILFPSGKRNAAPNAVDLNKLASVVSWSQGFLWGIASILDKTCTKKSKLRQFACKSELNLFIAFFEKFINSCFHALLLKDSRQPDGLYVLTQADNEDDASGLNDYHASFLKPSAGLVELSTPIQEGNVRSRRVDSLSDSGDEPEKVHHVGTNFVQNSRIKKRVKSQKAEYDVNILPEVDLYDRELLNKPLLRSLLKGDKPEMAYLVRQLFVGSSAILSLKQLIHGVNFSSMSMPISIGTSLFLLMELGSMIEEPHTFSYVWLDGVLKYLDVFTGYLFRSKSFSLEDVYPRLIDIHLRVIGRCSSLQGKGATLESHDTKSSIKILTSQVGSSRSSLSYGKYSLDEFIARLRMSLKRLIKEPLKLNSFEKETLDSHILAATEALESALAGIQKQHNMIYEINTGGPYGGKVSPIVVGGIDCLNLVLQSVPGDSCPSKLKIYIQRSVSALFNIVLHLQSPLIFYEQLAYNNGVTSPDPGAVILMCIEVLTKVAGKPKSREPESFWMSSHHVSQSLRLPSSLFQDFLHLRSFEAPTHSMLSTNQDLAPSAGKLPCNIDRLFSVDLFVSCCKLLCAILQHHTSASGRCISVLQDSVSVLLHCLETKAKASVERECYFEWEVREGIVCASFLRRIYELINEQKEKIGRYASRFLSNYILVFSGYGPSKSGIRREINEALRPGIYALVEACSEDDFQQLHTVFGEGPCRRSLADLQQDYKLNFQYQGFLMRTSGGKVRIREALVEEVVEDKVVGIRNPWDVVVLFLELGEGGEAQKVNQKKISHHHRMALVGRLWMISKYFTQIL